MDSLWLFLGRLHPLAVHLPIGILLLLAVIEGVALFPGAPRLNDSARRLILGIAAIASIAAAAFGWMLAADGEYDVTLLERHRNLGLVTTGLAVALWVVSWLGWRRVYGATLVLTLSALCAAGHFGGSLTHGENYLAFSDDDSAPVLSTDPAKAVVYQDIIHPILEQRCVKCHGPAKSNGDLRYDQWGLLVQGGKTGPAFKAGDAATSEMIRRAHLPLDAKKHMPPKGKPQLTDDELALLEWWIDAGAPREATLLAMTPPPDIVDVLAPRFPSLKPPIPNRPAMLAAAVTLENKLGALIRPLSADTPWLAVNARLLGRAFGDAQLAELAPIAPAVYALDVGETGVTDAGLAILSQMPQLRRLRLDRTAITDSGLKRLSMLGSLETLNLHGTAVSDAGLRELEPLKRLRSLFLWQTKVTPAAVDILEKELVDPRRVRRWEEEIAALRQQIRSEQFKADFGANALNPKTDLTAENAKNAEKNPNR